MENVVDYYRYLHRHPEVSNQEENTSRYIENTLQAAGYTPQRKGKYGVIADLVTDDNLPWIVLRADMDALPVQENSCVAWPSENKGVMHACGHDSHTAMLLAAAEKLQGRKLPQNVRFLFQPAEEVTEGAREMIEAGAMPQNAKACFGAHVWPGVPFGKIATRPGALMAFTDRIHIVVTGKSAHCGQQHNGINALTCALKILNAFPTAQALAQDARTVLFCGSLHSGDAHNVVAEKAEITGTLRTFLENDCLNIKAALEKACRDAEKATGAKVELNWECSVPALNNDETLIQRMQTLFADMDTDIEATPVAEDFSLLEKQAPGVLVWLGLGDVPPLHNSAFYVPEEILPIGVNFWLTIANTQW